MTLPANELSALRTKVIEDIIADQKSWRITSIPQIIILLALAVILSGLAAFGVYNSVMTLTSGDEIASVKKGIEVFVTGSSSILGFVVIKLFGKLKENTESYIREEKRFTSDKNMIEIAESREEIGNILRSYYKIGDA
ncbi:hypothetical protein D1814_17560 [Alteromonas sp. BL110]|uniref:hypothetical protein n=1 Tax=Alteromonas sp. BL110 TaxID=1714845 RepID=UPI000E4BF943|nr:hypothetical protein [Alteromonas sp. BL110]AXT40358.1 hypothetical protein D1814_17560 [Alteromonas sp. BL110]RKM79590.1 hypothetical protein D7031_11555 [Alteromonas sp. BL110]